MSTPPTPATPSASEAGGLEIRPATAQDLEAVGRLTAAVYVGEGYIGEDAAYVEELTDAAGRAERAELWVAVRGPDLLGSVAFCPVGSTMREVGREGEGEFRMLAVAADARGQGVGRALVQACVDRSRELGYDAVRICSLREMADAHRLYAALGFRRSPEDDWCPHPGVQLLAFVAPLA